MTPLPGVCSGLHNGIKGFADSFGLDREAFDLSALPGATREVRGLGLKWLNGCQSLCPFLPVSLQSQLYNITKGCPVLPMAAGQGLGVSVQGNLVFTIANVEKRHTCQRFGVLRVDSPRSLLPMLLFVSLTFRRWLILRRDPRKRMGKVQREVNALLPSVSCSKAVSLGARFPVKYQRG